MDSSKAVGGILVVFHCLRIAGDATFAGCRSTQHYSRREGGILVLTIDIHHDVIWNHYTACIASDLRLTWTGSVAEMLA